MKTLLQWLAPKRAQYLFWITLVVISIGALMPADEVTITTGWDKSNHALGFFVLAALAGLSWLRQPWWRPALALFAYGILMEVAQHFVGRDASALDVVADVVGIAICTVLMQLTGWRPACSA